MTKTIKLNVYVILKSGTALGPFHFTVSQVPLGKTLSDQVVEQAIAPHLLGHDKPFLALEDEEGKRKVYVKYDQIDAFQLEEAESDNDGAPIHSIL